jgi:hypothetical protein
LTEVLNKLFVSVPADSALLDSTVLSNLRDKLGHVPDHFVVSKYYVHCALRHQSVNKSSSDDVLSNRLIVKLADILAAPICAIINSTIKHGTVPTRWKIARVAGIPKVNPAVSLECDFFSNLWYL